MGIVFALSFAFLPFLAVLALAFAFAFSLALRLIAVELKWRGAVSFGLVGSEADVADVGSWARLLGAHAFAVIPANGNA